MLFRVLDLDALIAEQRNALAEAAAREVSVETEADDAQPEEAEPEDVGPEEPGSERPAPEEPAPPGQTPVEGDPAAPPVESDPDAAVAPPEPASPEIADGPPPEEPFELDFEAVEFEVLAEVESTIPGEERVLRAPIEPGWLGRRLEVVVHYEASGASGEESPPRALDIAPPLPAPDGLDLRVDEHQVTVRWSEPAHTLPVGHGSSFRYELFRERGESEEPVGQAYTASLADVGTPVFGEEVCYRVRLVRAGADEDFEVPDPGPGDAGEASQEWTSRPARVPATGSSASNVGPLSAAECVVPLDIYPPPSPAALRVVWRPERTELSWEPRDASGTDDLAGFHVYRSGPGDAEPLRLTGEPVRIPAFDDVDRDPWTAFSYSVTAVDGADPPNESRPTRPTPAVPRRPAVPPEGAADERLNRR